jgi:hypothetical protein
VAPTAVTGVARIQQNGAWSNAIGFIVPVAGGSNTLAPSMLNMVVGDTHTIQALSAAGQPATGLAWTSSDSTIVSLSSDNPPILTALAVGHVTVTAGTASTDVTVWPGALPLGTVVWSNPGDGSGVTSIVPAVPSATGVADVFAFQADGTVQAITSDGATAWTADASHWQAVPDFQGGLVVWDGSSVWKLDGINGKAYPAYAISDNAALAGVYTDGTILLGPGRENITLIDPMSGTPKFTVPMPAEAYGWYGTIIGGDGYAYMPYAWRSADANGYLTLEHLRVLRVNSSGASDDIKIGDYTGDCGDTICTKVFGMISNADQGIVLTFWPGDKMHMAITTGTSVSDVSAPQVGDQAQVAPVLQAQDGSFVGTARVGPDWDTTNMVAFDVAGNVRWVVPNMCPQIATADGGVIAQAPNQYGDCWGTTGPGFTFDQNGNATGMMNLPTYSWSGYAYQDGPVEQLVASALDFALTFMAFQGGNLGHTGTAVKLVQGRIYLPDEIGDTQHGNSPLTSSYAAEFNKHYAPTQIALKAFAFGAATADNFLVSLQTTNRVVGFVGHAFVWTTQPPPQIDVAEGLCFFGNNCLMPSALIGSVPAPSGFTWAPFKDGFFSPKAKVVFLGACGIDDNFIAQWHLQEKGQALIVPVYQSFAKNGPPNSDHSIDLPNAALDLEFILDQMTVGNTVGAALDMINNLNGAKTNYYWKVVPEKEGRNVGLTTPSH